MRRMTQNELRQCQIGILDFIDDLCKKHDLRYWLDFGTLLGAVRHKGYIPWDDDIDISMLREDYDKLIDICKKNPNNRYRLSCVELDPDSMYPFGKFIDTTTVLYELGEDGIKTGVYVDVFVYDNAPLSEESRNKAFNLLDIYGYLRICQLPLRDAPFSLKRIVILFVKELISFLPKQYFTRKIVKAAEKFKHIESNLVCDFTCPFYSSRWCVDKKIFSEIIDLEFEGKKYKAPLKYDKWLKLQYGDYMVLPSKEQQLSSQHDIEAFFID